MEAVNHIAMRDTVVARYGRERYGARLVLERHRHRDCYAAVVLSGRYEEAGSEGRFEAGAGDVIVHYALDAHLDRISANGVELLNLPLPSDAALCSGWVDDPDELVRCYEADPAACAALLSRRLKPCARRSVDWPDALREALASRPRCSLKAFAGEWGLRRETVSRRFAQMFGLAPASFRAEARTRRAWRRVVTEATPLAEIAYAEGFADQAHMARAIRGLTGATASAWRRSNLFKTGAAVSQ